MNKIMVGKYYTYKVKGILGYKIYEAVAKENKREETRQR